MIAGRAERPAAHLLDERAVVGQEQERDGRALDLARVAAELGAVAVEQRHLPAQGRDVAPHVPLVGVLRGDAQGHLLAAAADQQRQRLLYGFGLEHRGVERVVLALERGRLVREQGLDQLGGLGQPLEPFLHGVERDPVLAVLVLLPAGAEPEHEPAAAQVVDGRRHLREHRRVAVGVAGDERADADARHRGREPGERGPRLGVRHARGLAVGHEVVRVPETVEADRLGVARDLEHVGEDSGSARARR